MIICIVIIIIFPSDQWQIEGKEGRTKLKSAVSYELGPFQNFYLRWFKIRSILILLANLQRKKDSI